MKPVEVTVTEAARNFADCINRVHYQGAEFILTKNGKPVARIVPEKKTGRTGKEIAEALRGVELDPAEARAWHKDLMEARQSLRPQRDKWA